MQVGVSPEIKTLLVAAGLSGEHVNPGGREFAFRDGRRLHIGDDCVHCDEKKIREFLLQSQ